MQLAEELHLSQNTLSNLENGKSKIDVELLYRFADYFEIDPLELIEKDNHTFNFYNQVENGYIQYIKTLNSDSKELIKSLQDQLTTKDEQIKKLLELLNK